MVETNYRTMTEIVYEHILREVHTGVLKPGDKIVIERITRELATSAIDSRIDPLCRIAAATNPESTIMGA